VPDEPVVPDVEPAPVVPVVPLVFPPDRVEESEAFPVPELDVGAAEFLPFPLLAF
jgi:hypothetical protein